MARSRRMRNRQQEAPEPAPEQEYDDDMAMETGDLMPADIEEPETGPVSRNESSVSDRNASSSVRSRGRSSRRAAGSSVRGSQRKSARKELSPEEKAARRAAFRNAVLTVLIIAVVGGGGAFAYFNLREEKQQVPLTLRGEERVFVGTKAGLSAQYLSAARAFHEAAETAIAKRQTESAKANIEAMNTVLTQPQLGSGSQASPEDENIGDLAMAQRALEMLEEVPALKQRLQRVEDDNQASANFNNLRRQVGSLNDVKDLDALTQAINRFRENPVRPTEGSDPVLQERYKTMVDEMAAKLKDVSRERLTRLIKDTSQVVDTINLESQKYIAKGQYGMALSLVDEAAINSPQADLKGVRQKVLKAAESGWETDRGTAENLYKDAIAPGAGDAMRTGKIRQAIEVLQNVIDTYGKDVAEIRGYVSDAERMMREYQSKL
ncbi:MAG: hypothetical protein PF961_03780 [Planctomycetota bacterium]|jgi:hypothetical protein|nr:hypothetical protein [Planctomycetota bacterium]